VVRLRDRAGGRPARRRVRRARPRPRRYDELAIEVPGDDSDVFAIDVDPGETVTVLLEPDPGLRAQLDLADADGPLASGAAAAAGDAILLQTVATRGRLAGVGPGPRTYRLRVGAVDASLGGYALRVTLNAALEEEGHGGERNDSIDAAQDLKASFAWDQVAGALYGIEGGPGASTLYALDLTSGRATPVGTTSFQAGSLEFGPDGALYGGGTGPADGGMLFRIDPATGASTPVGPTGLDSLTGLALRAGPGQSDFYAVELAARQRLEVQSYTPAGQSGEFLNAFDPLLRLYDAAAVLLATDDDSGPTGATPASASMHPPGPEGRTSSRSRPLRRTASRAVARICCRSSRRTQESTLRERAPPPRAAATASPPPCSCRRAAPDRPPQRPPRGAGARRSAARRPRSHAGR
jgi:hypothetical protein